MKSPNEAFVGTEKGVVTGPENTHDCVRAGEGPEQPVGETEATVID